MLRELSNPSDAPEITLESATPEIKPLLPDTLGEFLCLSIADGRKLDPEIYRPSYAAWHLPVYERVRVIHYCSVCLAGAVMAGTLGCDSVREWKPKHFSPSIERKLRALEYCRQGTVRQAISVFYDRVLPLDAYVGLTRDIKNASFTTREEFNAFLDEMEILATDLKKEGL